MRAFLILHGWDNFRPPGHWQHELASALRRRGERVVYPQLPDAADPDVEAWRAAAAAALDEAAADGARVTVIAHSLGAALWLGARPDDSEAGAVVDRVLLVSPPSPGFLRGNPEVAAFAELPVSRPAAQTRIVASDADPCCPEGAWTLFAEPLGIPLTTIPGGGHLTIAAGYGEWPSVLDWCLDPTAAIVPR
ncbi:alpha/beta hydrolase [Leifsonia sp. TF02-11]|uniref:RBBP9/YdeN family alpha/beta hydrolase n=1 Tax=Leifsonia sp. TF02-11 TaxID=2815212 RepID=UPI001AA0F0D1|nr:alpha/beta fold hydrolase [Leifsonia sp. TF02-11]MBO1737668.1 alpha/beta fold hydrolase [Leifsonia sp. TF02-11]